MAEQFGISTIKKAAKVAVNLGMKVEDALADDGKVSFMEVVGIAVGAFPGIFDVVRNAGALKLEYNDLSDEERDELVEYVIEELDLEADNIEAIIESGFDVLVSIEGLVDKISETRVEEQ